MALGPLSALPPPTPRAPISNGPPGLVPTGRAHIVWLGFALAPPFTARPIAPKRAAVGEIVAGETVLETEDLTKDFAGFVAVRSVNSASRAAPFTP